MALLSDKAFEIMAALLNLIEKGAEWPQPLLHGRAAFLEKDEDKQVEPLSFRVLLVLPTLYRKWAALRLANLQHWISKWAMLSMLAGTQGQGAADGSLRTALMIETCKLEDTPFTGGVTDIYKCLDQLIRGLIYRLLEIGGMPKNIIKAYASFQDGLSVHNSIAGGLGEAYQKKCSIPQGCPMSMVITAFLMRPWLKKMEDQNAQGRIFGRRHPCGGGR